MQEISLNILDIAQNSIRAGAKNIHIEIVESALRDLFEFTVRDDGCGMSEELLRRVTDPFVTTRTTRKVGLGISLLKSAAQQTGGDVTIESELNKGTTLTATFSYSSIDRQPLGDIAAVIASLIGMNTQCDFYYRHTAEDKTFELDTKQLRAVLGDVSLAEISVVQWITQYINEGLTEIYGGVK